MTTALEGGEGSASRTGRSLPPGKTRYPLYRRLGGPQGRSGQVRKISPPPGFDARTAQPVASRYTDYATRPTKDRETGTETLPRGVSVCKNATRFTITARPLIHVLRIKTCQLLEMLQFYLEFHVCGTEYCRSQPM